MYRSLSQLVFEKIWSDWALGSVIEQLFLRCWKVHLKHGSSYREEVKHRNTLFFPEPMTLQSCLWGREMLYLMYASVSVKQISCNHHTYFHGFQFVPWQGLLIRGRSNVLLRRKCHLFYAVSGTEIGFKWEPKFDTLFVVSFFLPLYLYNSFCYYNKFSS